VTIQWLNLTQKSVLITGSTGCIGSVLARDFARQGANLLLLDRDPLELKKLQSQISDSFGEISVSICAVDFESCKCLDIVANFIKSFPCIDVVVHNAAFVGENNLPGWNTPFSSQSLSTWKRCFDVNLNIIFSMTQLLSINNLLSHESSIIMMSSIYGFSAPRWQLYENTSMGNPAAYAASKAAVIQFSKWLASTLAPEVRVNTVSPGGVQRSQPKLFQDRYSAMTPLGRMATEVDISNAVLFLASSRSSYITGQNIIVDGGWSI